MVDIKNATSNLFSNLWNNAPSIRSRPAVSPDHVQTNPAANGQASTGSAATSKLQQPRQIPQAGHARGGLATIPEVPAELEESFDCTPGGTSGDATPEVAGPEITPEPAAAPHTVDMQRNIRHAGQYPLEPIAGGKFRLTDPATGETYTISISPLKKDLTADQLESVGNVLGSLLQLVQDSTVHNKCFSSVVFSEGTGHLSYGDSARKEKLGGPEASGGISAKAINDQLAELRKILDGQNVRIDVKKDSQGGTSK